MDGTCVISSYEMDSRLLNSSFEMYAEMARGGRHILVRGSYKNKTKQNLVKVDGAI